MAVKFTLVAKFALEIVPLIKFVEGLYVKLVSVSRRCDPVAPSTKVRYTVSSVELLARISALVANVAVLAVVALPLKELAVTIPVTFNSVKVPTLVNEELTTLDPSVVAERTSVPLIL